MIRRNRISQSKKTKRFMRQSPFIHIKANGSYTLEAMIVLPVFLTLMLMFLFYFRVLMVQQEVGNSLLKTARELSVAAYEYENAGASMPSAKLYYMKHSKKDAMTKRYVQGGIYGVRLNSSKLTGKEIHLEAKYDIIFPISLLGKRKIPSSQKVICRKWTGASQSDLESEEDPFVYITPTGVAYHKKADCTYLKPSIRSVQGASIPQLRNYDGGKYYACKRCTKGGKPSGLLYVSNYGSRYHKNPDCTEIKRMIWVVKRSKVGDRHACKKCWGESYADSGFIGSIGNT